MIESKFKNYKEEKGLKIHPFFLHNLEIYLNLKLWTKS